MQGVRNYDENPNPCPLMYFLTITAINRPRLKLKSFIPQISPSTISTKVWMVSGPPLPAPNPELLPRFLLFPTSTTIIWIPSTRFILSRSWLCWVERSRPVCF